jgi:hypothetical protein
MCEDALLTGALGPTREPHAIAKIAGITLRESYNCEYGERNDIAMSFPELTRVKIFLSEMMVLNR